MAEQFLQLSRDDRRDVLAIAAEKVGRPIHLLEKDAWVVWALQTLYGRRQASTSFSKVARPSLKHTRPSAGFRRMSPDLRYS